MLCGVKVRSRLLWVTEVEMQMGTLTIQETVERALLNLMVQQFESITMLAMTDQVVAHFVLIDSFSGHLAPIVRSKVWERRVLSSPPWGLLRGEVARRAFTPRWLGRIDRRTRRRRRCRRCGGSGQRRLGGRGSIGGAGGGGRCGWSQGGGGNQ